MDKKRKIIIGVSIAISVVILGGGALGFHNYSVKAEEKAKVVQKKEERNKIKKLKKEVLSYYTDDKKTNIKQEIEISDLKETSLDLSELTKNGKNDTKEVDEMELDIYLARKMLSLRWNVINLLDENGVLKENADVEGTEESVNAYKETKPEFFIEQKKALNEAKNQETQIKNAECKVNQLFATVIKEDVKEGITWDNYNVAKTEIDKIKQDKAKNSLLEYLKKPNEYLKKKDEQNKAKAAEQQAVVSEQAKENNSNANNNEGSSNSSQSNKSYNNSSNGSSSSSSKSNGSSSSKNYSSSNGSNNSGIANKGSSSTSKSTGGNTKSSGGESTGSKSSSNNSGNSTSPNYDYDKKSDSESNVNGGSNDYWGW
ncbi:hypothetical protein HCJ58_15060 [Listeria sp. FSL L7-1509]|uniref:Pesticidal crystal protein Cry1Aa domain-containing protein n=1 Tax=Listeria immobilis TaxID=2713502 RepID=A0ABR6T0D1_9LIST|nr:MULTISPECIES: toxin Cry1Ac domain D-VI-related protein [Listeria]MBC1484581.1 hypothetical protein [Listeria immobilis]MBC1508271.1 hypothetical protein [Listeria immobilis]MBC1511281.1 hypothetical protein [Listeria immobilis]MBC1839528.1 hypothetical protein [Listeria seeligeri]MBC6313682.1 hypothetical protein [Listeria immobilis]